MDSDGSIPHIILVELSVHDAIYDDWSNIYATRRNYLWHYSQQIYRSTVSA